jgi:hypothetical protein
LTKEDLTDLDREFPPPKSRRALPVRQFLERRRSLSPVQKIKINRVDAEALETALTSFWQFRA